MLYFTLPVIATITRMFDLRSSALKNMTKYRVYAGASLFKDIIMS